VQQQSELCYRLCLRQGFASWQAYAEVFVGWLAVVRGDPGAHAGIERMRGAIAAWQSAGMAIGVDGLVVVLADACLVAARRCPPGDAERAGLLATALEAINSVLGPRVPCGQSYQAELHRMRGELLLARDGLATAEEALACFRQAMQLGQEQAALAWELRAAMSLVRLRERQGDGFAAELAEARQHLRDVYGRFTEGFDFPDLQDAAALIANHPRQGIRENL
jgi:hypothetical protein